MRSLAPLVTAVAILSVSILSATASPESPSFTNDAAPTGVGGAGEPSIGVNPHTGATFFQAFSETLKVSWSASGVPTWVSVTPVSNRFMPNVDPLLATDPVTGRTYAGGLTPGFCSDFAYTDDDGATWVPFTLACPLTSADHPTVGAGPWHAPVPATATSPSALYVCQQSGTDRCVVSQDGGITYRPAVAIAGCSSFHGHVKVGPDGTAYVPSAYCGSLQGGFRTTTNGATWVAYRIPGARVDPSGGGFDPSVATTPDNVVYEAWSDGVDHHPWVARSTDRAVTWERAVDLAATVTPPIRVSTFQAVVAGDNDRVAVAFLGSVDGVGNPYSSQFVGTWDLYVSFTYDGGLTWETVKATSDPVQRGCIWDVVHSPECHRNLLDFMDATVSIDGRVLVGYADGCTSATCVGPSGTTASSGDDRGTIARQTGGPRLYAAFD